MSRGWIAHRPATFLATSLLAAGCHDGASGIAAPMRPAIAATSVAPNPTNALSAVVVVRVRDADSVAVRFSLAGNASSADSLTPGVTVTADSAVVPVLGLLPARTYTLRPVAYGAGGATLGESLDFTTDTLPSDLPRYTATGSDPSPGYLVFAAGAFGLVIDNTGRVVWYHRFPNGAGLNFIAQPNGRFAAFPPNGQADLGRWVEVDPLGSVTRELGCARGLRPRLHDFVAAPDGSYWLLCDETRTMDLTDVGGVASASVTGTVVQHVSAGGALLFDWSPFDHFAITDGSPADRRGASVNWTHGNAIDFDSDGNLIVSFRNLSEVTKIDVRTGNVLWRLGGRRNEFTFVDAPTPSFAGQHSARASAPGSLLLLDNIGDPAQSRAERYAIDERARTARLLQSYGTPGVMTLIGGSVQSLPGGRTLVSFGTAGRVEEYDADDRVVWRIEGNPGYVFRAQRIRSLYTPGVDGTAAHHAPARGPDVGFFAKRSLSRVRSTRDRR